MTGSAGNLEFNVSACYKAQWETNENKHSFSIIFFSFKEENLTGENLSKMNSSQICPTRDVVFLVWQIQDPTQTNHSCK